MGCARFAEILRICVPRQVFGRMCWIVFSCFYIEIAYSNFTFCGAFTRSVF